MALVKLGHVALQTPDIERSTEFFRDVVGLREIDTDDETVYLRGDYDRSHHSLSLTRSDVARIDHIGWRVAEESDLDVYAGALEETGTEVDWVSSGTERAQGRAIRFTVPAGHRYELYHQIELPSPEPNKLKNRFHTLTEANRINPQVIDHVALKDTDPHTHANWCRSHLDFQSTERITSEAGVVGEFMTVTNLNHNSAVIRGPDVGVSHVAYRVEGVADLFSAVDICLENGVEVSTPVKHNVSQAKSVYAIDPGCGLSVEIYTGGYPVFDTDWEPIEWSADEYKETKIGDHPSRGPVSYR